MPNRCNTQRLKRILSVSASNRLATVQSISLFDAISNIDNNHDKDTISKAKKSRKFHFRTDFSFCCRLVHRDRFFFFSPFLSCSLFLNCIENNIRSPLIFNVDFWLVPVYPNRESSPALSELYATNKNRFVLTCDNFRHSYVGIPYYSRAKRSERRKISNK